MQHDDVHQLVLSPLGPGRWRLCDRAVSGSDPASLVAYIERRGASSYEVVWVALPVGVQRFSQLDLVFEAAVALLHEKSAATRGKPVPIPHLPPL
jgi:hypothetical protein